ncbi:hypothetical protein QZJ86_19520 [Methylomonas montana]|uniref:hypothetical protein n=1 Tax=Methylomonas montana TaxID=3058963 RepID=UPI002659E0BA|nr:hypothetical protein [Methylomonas montana]WKJ90175.1 hypothetical protein QZJ86_19520 [Methylomonas montana]
MPDTTYKQAAGLIREAEKISALPVRVTWDDTLQVGAVLHLSEAQWSISETGFGYTASP